MWKTRVHSRPAQTYRLPGRQVIGNRPQWPPAPLRATPRPQRRLRGRMASASRPRPLHCHAGKGSPSWRIDCERRMARSPILEGANRSTRPAMWPAVFPHHPTNLPGAWVPIATPLKECRLEKLLKSSISNAESAENTLYGWFVDVKCQTQAEQP